MDEPDVPETGAVFTFGKSRFADNTPSKFWIRRDRVVQISCGDEHTAVVCQSGRLFTFGANEWGQLGLGSNTAVIKPSCVKSLKQVGAVRTAACGKAHTVVSVEIKGKPDNDEDGNSGGSRYELYSFGSNADGQLGKGRSVEMSDKPVRIDGASIYIGGSAGDTGAPILSAGSSHSLALLPSDGKVLVWGSNTEGQLGLGADSEETVFLPVVLKLDLEPDEMVKQISCGYYHNAVVTTTGRLFIFGDRGRGKLGLPLINKPNGDAGSDIDDDEVDEPTELPMEEEVSSVSCGGEHTLALTTSGRVYSFGSNANGQLGLGTNVQEALKPNLIQSLVNSGHSIEKICCGENHSSMVTTQGLLVTFGDGRHGKLCLDQETLANQHTPAFSDKFSGFRVVSAHCGGCHTMVMALPIPEDKQGTAATTEAVINGVDQASNSAPVGNGRPGVIDDQVNRAAREKRHLSMQQQQQEKALPPIRQRPPLPSDPEEILNIGSELVHVNGSKDAEEGDERDDDEDKKEEEDAKDERLSDSDQENDKSDKSKESEKEDEEDEDEKRDEVKEKIETTKEKTQKSKFKVSNLFRGFKSWKEDIPITDDIKKELGDEDEEDKGEGEENEDASEDENYGTRKKSGKNNGKLSKKVSFMSQEAVYVSPAKAVSNNKQNGRHHTDGDDDSDEDDEVEEVKDIEEGDKDDDGDSDKREKRKTGGKKDKKVMEQSNDDNKVEEEEKEKKKKRRSKMCSVL